MITLGKTEEKEMKSVCLNCGKELDETAIREYNNSPIFLCDDCFPDSYTVCDDCGKIIINEDCTYVDRYGHDICNRCLDDYYKCESCGDYFNHNDDIYIANNANICHSCYESGDFNTCDRCGDILSSNYMTYCNSCERMLCQDCSCDCDDEDEHDHRIHSYTYKPEPIFYGKGKKVYGIELEIDEVDSVSDFIDNIEDIDEIYLKNDGSLSSSGVEIVSHPCTLDYYKNNFPFEKIINAAKKETATSHNNGHCGLHVHINREYFDNYELSATKIVLLFEKFWPELLKFSRRTNTHYCNKNKNFKVCPETVKKIKSTMTEDGRYCAVNLCPQNTIEIRLWRGTLLLTSIFAILEITDLITTIANSMSIIELQKLTWDGFKKLAEKDRLKNFLAYCKEKNI